MLAYECVVGTIRPNMQAIRTQCHSVFQHRSLMSNIVARCGSTSSSSQRTVSVHCVHTSLHRQRLHTRLLHYSTVLQSTESNLDKNLHHAKQQETQQQSHAAKHYQLDGPTNRYNLYVVSGKLNEDPNQRKTIQVLQNLYDELQHYEIPPIRDITTPHTHYTKHHHHHHHDHVARTTKTDSNFWSRLWGPKSQENNVSQDHGLMKVKGLYLYGEPGTGKTMIMDLFYDSIKTKRKKRVHFHSFMLDVHARLHTLRKQHPHSKHIISRVATEIANECWLLCFDEFQVTDIADAMILRSLVWELMSKGVVIVTTSNRHPDELYKNGIQRASFIPCIELLKEKMTVHQLNGGIDYRKQKKPSSLQTYFYPLTSSTSTRIEFIWSHLTNPHATTPTTLHLLGREWTLHQTCPQVSALRISFAELCRTARSAADYLALVQKFKVVFVEEVPVLSIGESGAGRSEIRRWITFIDAAYENKTTLIITSAVQLSNLFVPYASSTAINLMDADLDTTDEEIFAFQRTLSRMVEMGSVGWCSEDVRKVLEECEALKQ